MAFKLKGPLNMATGYSNLYDPNNYFVEKTATKIRWNAANLALDNVWNRNIEAEAAGTDFMVAFTGAWWYGLSNGTGSIMAVKDSHITDKGGTADRTVGKHSIEPWILHGGVSGWTIALREYTYTTMHWNLFAGWFTHASGYFELSRVGSTIVLDAWTDSGKGTHISGYPLSSAASSGLWTPTDLNVISNKIASGYGQGYIENLYYDFGKHPAMLGGGIGRFYSDI